MPRATNLDASVSFLRGELGLGLTFALIAANARSEDKFNRNRRNAQKACDTARRFLKHIELSEGQAEEFREMLEELERRLQSLNTPPERAKS